MKNNYDDIKVRVPKGSRERWKSWSNVGTLMNQSGDNCRKIFNRFLKTLKAKEDCESGE